jgi:hypothetical protein
MFMATSIWAIEVIEVDEVTGVTVLCISNLIVVQSKEGHMIQLMRSKGKRGIAIGGDAGIPIPMPCKDYD